MRITSTRLTPDASVVGPVSFYIGFNINSGRIFDFQELLSFPFDQQDVSFREDELGFGQKHFLFVSHNLNDVHVQILPEICIHERFSNVSGRGEDEQFAEIGAHAEFAHEIRLRRSVRNEPASDEKHIKKADDRDRYAHRREFEHSHRTKLRLGH
jgi:hypothetical protein